MSIVLYALSISKHVLTLSSRRNSVFIQFNNLWTAFSSVYQKYNLKYLDVVFSTMLVRETEEDSTACYYINFCIMQSIRFWSTNKYKDLTDFIKYSFGFYDTETEILSVILTVIIVAYHQLQMQFTIVSNSKVEFSYSLRPLNTHLTSSCWTLSYQ